MAFIGNLGTVFQSVGEYEKARVHHEKALALSKSIGDKNGEAVHHGKLGGFFCLLLTMIRLNTNFKWERTIAVHKEIGNRGEEASSYEGLGNAYNLVGENKRAKECYEKWLAIKLEIGDRGGEVLSYGNIGTTYLSVDEFKDVRAQKLPTHRFF